MENAEPGCQATDGVLFHASSSKCMKQDPTLIILCRAYASVAYSVTEIAHAFGVRLSTALRIAKSLDAKLKT